MTREEAIKSLKVLRKDFSGYKPNEEVFDMAIKALEQEPRKDEVILTKKEYGELVSSEFENGYAKGYREAMEEQETCEDAVSREAVLGLFNKSDMHSWAMSLLKRKIEEMPPVKPVACIAEIKFSKEDMQELINEKIKEITAELEQTKWIPVKERLPETDGDYLLFGKIDDFDDEYYKFIGEFDSAAEKFGIWRDCFDPNTLGCLGSEFYEYGEVLAWMPLPEPYKGETEEEENES